MIWPVNGRSESFRKESPALSNRRENTGLHHEDQAGGPDDGEPKLIPRHGKTGGVRIPEHGTTARSPVNEESVVGSTWA
jgi:hypothetical protein